ncbi:MAG: hypothetical protein JKY01_05050 [Pseudomonadales bacterium]|nr:hypothetical protein [Pseudomonadales bacterium]
MSTDAQPLLSILKHYHQWLEHLLLCQQEALIEQRFELANQILSHHQALLFAHIQLENSLLLPLHEKVSKPRWASSLYQLEHDKILTLLSRAQEKLFAAQQDSKRSQRRLAIELLDYQRTLKGVLDHHEQREEQGLIPELLSIISPAEENVLAKQLETQWQRDFSARERTLEPLLAQLGLHFRS